MLRFAWLSDWLPQADRRKVNDALVTPFQSCFVNNEPLQITLTALKIMELAEAEVYTVASLFALALHCSQAELQPYDGTGTPWG